MKYLYPKVIDTKVNTDNRGYLVETFKKKKKNIFLNLFFYLHPKEIFFGGCILGKKKKSKITYCFKRVCS